jgi:hypothetical protein
LTDPDGDLEAVDAALLVRAAAALIEALMSAGPPV